MTAESKPSALQGVITLVIIIVAVIVAVSGAAFYIFRPQTADFAIQLTTDGDWRGSIS